MIRECTKCGSLGVLTTDFYRHSSTKTGYHTHCKQCYRKQTARNYRANHAERRKAANAYYYANRDATLIVQKKRTRLRRYKLTDEQFQAKIAKQKGKCAICSTTEPGGSGTWHVDHDHTCCPGRHSCGQCVRGLLCSTCNTRLGVHEDFEWRDKADIYIAEYLVNRI